MYLLLVGLPLAIAGVTSAYVYRAPSHDPGLWFSLLAYVVGTLPGIVLFLRFLVTRRARVIFGLSYAILSLLAMSAVTYAVGCLMTDICLNPNPALHTDTRKRGLHLRARVSATRWA